MHRAALTDALCQAMGRELHRSRSGFPKRDARLTASADLAGTRLPSLWRGATFARIVVRERRYVLAPGADTERLAAQ